MKSQKWKVIAESALKNSPERWNDECCNFFPEGKNPWTDLYSKKVVDKIGDIIGLDQAADFYDLRILLASAAEDAFRNFRFVGGPAADGKKQKWRTRVIKDAKRLKTTLRRSDDNYSSTVSLDGRKLRIVPSSEMAKKTQAIISELDDLIALVEQSDRFIERNKMSDTKKERSSTQHMQYLQYVVDGMTGVFIHFQEHEAIKRANSDVTYGEFPDFIRAAAAPTLMAYYQGYSDNPKRPSNLNVQIQEVVKHFKNQL